MAETKNYVSKYSGDQLDAAIAVLGSLETMFFSQEDFEAFTKKFNTQMTKLKNEVTKLMDFANKAIIFAEEIKDESNNG